MHSSIMNSHPKEIALLIDYSSNYYRTIVTGVSRYNKLTGWQFYTYRGIPQITETQLKKWNGAGVIGRLSPELIELLDYRGVPSVNIKTDHEELSGHSVLMDNHKMGKMAAEYFIEKGIRHFASTAWSIKGVSGTSKMDSYAATLRSHGYENKILRSQGDINNLRGLIPMEKGHTIGVYAAQDFLGRMVIDASLKSGLRVPEDVAVLSTDNDSFICEMLTPTMSSLELGAERIGYQAASLLDRLIQGKEPHTKLALIPPERIVERQSTEILAMQDKLVGKALKFIKENAQHPITVDDLTVALHCNRRVLEICFKAEVGRTLHKEIRRTRIQRACKLLRETDMLIEVLAEVCGYSNRERFNAAFRNEMGKTPSTYRREFRFASNVQV